MKLKFSSKRLEINKANTQTLITLAVASFISVFCLIAAQALLTQNSYLSKVIAAKQKTQHQLTANLTAANTLLDTYQAFENQKVNLIGGSSAGNGDQDGDNARLILDALPSTYDFPALTSSIEKVLARDNFKVSSISGADDEVSQQASLSSPNPVPVAMPFMFTITDTSYPAVQQLMTTLQTSIRPLQIDSLTLSGANTNMQLSVSAHTFYQPGKNLTITKKVVK